MADTALKPNQDNEVRSLEEQMAYSDIVNNYGQTSETSGSDILAQEQAASNDLYTSGDKEPADEAKKSKIKSAGSFLKRNSKKTIVGGALGVGIAGVAIFAQLGTLFLPTLQNNIDSDRFRHIGRLIANNNDVIVKLKMMVDSTNDAEYAQALEEFKPGNPGSNLFTKLNQLRPTKIVENLLLNSRFDYDTFTIPGTNIERQRINSVTIEGTTIPVPKHGYNLAQRVIPPEDWADNGWAEPIKTSKEWAAGALSETTLGGKLPWGMRFIIVSSAAKAYREQINSKMWRWTKAEVDEADKDPQPSHDAKSTEYARTFNNNKDSLPPADDENAKRMQEETSACVEEKGCRDAMINDQTTISPDAQETLDSAFTPSLIRNAIGNLSTTQAWAAVVCTIAESSVVASAAIINANTQMAAKSYDQVAAGADQQKYSQLHEDDKRVNPTQVGGFNGQLNEGGTSTNSVPMRRAAGEPYTTAAILSPAAGAIGMFGTNPTGFLGAGAARAITGDDGKVTACDVIQHWSTGVILAIGEIGFAFTGTGAAAKAAGTTLAKRALSVFGTVVKSQFSRSALIQNGALVGTEQVANVLTQVAKARTLQLMGAFYNGMAGGSTLIDQADAGATVLSQATSRQYGGRVKTTDEHIASTQTDKDYVLTAMAEQSISQRYFAINNPQSLTSKLAVNLYNNANFQSLGSLAQNAASFFNPATMFASLTPSAGAAPGDNPDLYIQEREYGIPPFGWSNDEEQAFLTNTDYGLLYNEKVLDESGQRDELMEEYGKCFDGANVELGTLLANGDVSRDENANVIDDEGTCAPKNLGDNAPNDGRVTFKDDKAEMVFRLRISIRAERGIDDLLGIQDPQSEQYASSGGPVNSEGYAFPLEPATQRSYSTLPCDASNATNIVDGMEVCHHDGTGAFDLMFGSPESMGGKAVYAIYDAEVVGVNSSYGGVSGCYSITLKGADDFFYWYGHLQNGSVSEGDDVTAGQKIAEVAKPSFGSSCWGGTPHLHIDRAKTRGCAGVKSNNCRDPNFVPFMNDLWSGLPPE